MPWEVRRGLRLALPSATATVNVGVESEYSLYDDTGRQVDFRHLLPLIAADLRPLDPGDPRARRLPSGVALTADGLDAELATPPLEATVGVAEQINDLLEQEKQALTEASRPHGVVAVRGFSTHLNISVDDARVVSIGKTFAIHCAPALALITEPEDSWGVFVRPRRHRLEYGGDYVTGSRLTEAVELFIGSVLGLLADDPPPPAPGTPIEPSREKFGWYLPQAHLTPPSRLAEVRDWAGSHLPTHQVEPTAPHSTHPRDLIVDGIGPVSAETEWLTWSHAVWRLTGESATAFAVVPVALEGAFLSSLDQGAIHPEIRQMLTPSVVRRTLVVNHDLRVPALWHRIRPGALVPAERDQHGRIPRISAAKARRAFG